MHPSSPTETGRSLTLSSPPTHDPCILTTSFLTLHSSVRLRPWAQTRRILYVSGILLPSDWGRRQELREERGETVPRHRSDGLYCPTTLQDLGSLRTCGSVPRRKRDKKKKKKKSKRETTAVFRNCNCTYPTEDGTRPKIPPMSLLILYR